MFCIISLSCETEFVNPNAPTDEAVLTTRDGLINLSVGIKVLYSTTGIRFMIENNAITAREAAITTTFLNMVELEQGAGDLPDFNSNVEGLWAIHLRIMSACEDLMDAAPNVELNSTTRENLIAYGAFFKALSIGALAQNYTHVVIQTSRDNNAEFVPREEALAQAIELLQDAKNRLSGGISDEFNSNVLQGLIDLPNAVNAYLARYHLFLGNYDQAITAANNVDLSSTSEFIYDQFNQNPIWNRVILTVPPSFLPRVDFGLPAELAPETEDGRISFFLSNTDDPQTNVNGFSVVNLAGFFTNDSRSIPLYLPGEISLIIAEANVRKASQDLAAALNAINAVRTKTDDPFGVNAGLGEYVGPVNTQSLLDEIYRNRRIELFLTGLSLEDSRRFNRSVSTAPSQFDTERNRNFYPFALRERNNNPNTPQNPPI